MTQELHEAARAHLIRPDGQEDLCFGVWFPSKGRLRTTAILRELVLPREGERTLHGNVGFGPGYFQRALKEAAFRKGGLAFMHSHPAPGWQDMSPPDANAEAGHAAAALAATGLQLLGLTVGSDGSWSARLWFRTGVKEYRPAWCNSVRVVGERLVATYNPRIVKPYSHREELKRTVSFWGQAAQEHIGRLAVGICGLGSVGSVVNECLARMGVRTISLIDFDLVKPHNLDRTAGASRDDARVGALKVSVAARNAAHAATAEGFEVRALEHSIVERDGYEAALDCDVLFSCVDRPWPRRVLNHIAYAHLIPVVDGGITVRFSKGRFKNANWAVRLVGPERACLECTEAYDPGLVAVDMDGYLNEPSYIDQLPEESPIRRNENIFPLSMSLAAHEVIQFVALTTGLASMYNVGEQRFSYYPGMIHVRHLQCDATCPFVGLVGLGDEAERNTGRVTGTDKSAQRSKEADSRDYKREESESRKPSPT